MKWIFAAAALAATSAVAPAFGQESVEALSDAFCAALVAEDADAVGNLYAEDAAYYGVDGANHKGREAIRADWAAFIDAFDKLTCKLNLEGRNADKKGAVSWGTWEITGTPAAGGGMVTMTGRFMDYSVKTKDGWKYRADHASMSKVEGSDAAPAEAN